LVFHGATAQQNILDYSLLDHYTVKHISASSANASLKNLTDKDINTCFEIKNFSGEPWIQVESDVSLLVKGYSLISSEDAVCDPKNFRLEGSNDGVTWTRIGNTALGKTFSGRRQVLTIAHNTNNTAYTSFRLVFLQINGGTDLKVAEFQLFGYPSVWEDDLTDEGNVAVTGQFPGSGSDVLANLLTNNVGQIFKQNNQKTAWIQYELPQATAIGAYSLIATANNSIENGLRSWKLVASNDAQQWDVLDVRSNKSVFELSNNRQVYPIAATTKHYDWAAYADYSQSTLIDLFWKKYGSGNYLIHSTHANPDSINTGFNYWWMAHALDVFVDGYARTQNEDYRSKMKLIRSAMLSWGGNSLKNGFFDDMEWMGLACLRAHQVYSNYPNWKSDAINLWNWIKLGWNDNHGGGIQWVDAQPASKNACSNAPAIILAARLYNETGEQDYLDWAKRIFDWMNDNLIFEDNGLVKDAFGNDQLGWTLTYNQGIWIGACLELYAITNEQKYYDIAMRTADYVVNDHEKFSPYGILYNNEGGGDGGLFKGIFMRYLSQWILSGKLDKTRENQFVSYFIENGKSLWETALSFPSGGSPTCLFGNTWYKRRNDILPTDSRSAGYDASIHLSAVMMFELLDELDRNGFLPANNVHPSAVENKDKAYKYFRLEVEANQGGNNLELARWQLFTTSLLSNQTPVITEWTLPVKIRTCDRTLFLTKTGHTTIDYSVWNIQGQRLASGLLNETQEIALSQGIYIVRLSDGAKQAFTHKFIIY
jgi:predicted alpha-1,6-mannanase (GH76 family)